MSETHRLAHSLANDLREVLPEEPFVRTADLVAALVVAHPERWGSGTAWGRELTPQRFGRVMARHFGVRTTKDAHDRRGYRTDDLRTVIA